MVMCPFAYRGYNYDYTTGLYYLQSRYYNPEWGRFLNCDDTNILLATQGETLGANLFAYCNNNPVNRVDYTGYECEELISNLIRYVLLPIVSLVYRLEETGYAHLLDYNSTPVLTIAPSGILEMHFSCTIVSDSDGLYNYQEKIAFSFYYGDYDTWDNLFGEKTMASLIAAAGFGLVKKAAKTVVKYTLPPYGALLSPVVSLHLKSIGDFISDNAMFKLRSISALQKIKKSFPNNYQDVMFCALGTICFLSYNDLSPDSGYSTELYGGDKYVTPLV